MTVEKASKFSSDTLLFHKDSFSLKEVNVDIAVIVFSDGPCKLKFKTFSFLNKFAINCTCNTTVSHVQKTQSLFSEHPGRNKFQPLVGIHVSVPFFLKASRPLCKTASI